MAHATRERRSAEGVIPPAGIALDSAVQPRSPPGRGIQVVRSFPVLEQVAGLHPQLGNLQDSTQDARRTFLWDRAFGADRRPSDKFALLRFSGFCCRPGKVRNSAKRTRQGSGGVQRCKVRRQGSGVELACGPAVPARRGRHLWNQQAQECGSGAGEFRGPPERAPRLSKPQR
ncbi:hypothetical protein L1887_55518 [Cichorium endivia]|nr:hypothetical protein L1887_55518 [Cichorium endivia]